MELKESEPKLRRGQKAPEFNLPGTDGNTYSLEDFSEYKALLIVFTCNPDPHARAKIPVLNQLTEDYDQLAVVGINSNFNKYPGGTKEDNLENMREYVEGSAWYIDVPVRYDAYLRDDDQRAARLYGAVCTPDPFLFKNIDDEFRLAYHGRIDDALELHDEPSKHHMREAVEAVLADEPVKMEFLPSKGSGIKWGVVATQGIHRPLDDDQAVLDDED